MSLCFIPGFGLHCLLFSSQIYRMYPAIFCISRWEVNKFVELGVMELKPKLGCQLERLTYGSLRWLNQLGTALVSIPTSI